MQRLSKGFFLGSAAVAGAIANILVIIGTIMIRDGQDDGLGVIAVAYVPIIYLAVVMFVLYHKMWAAIQDGHARTSPGKAVGFLFIPIFNIYWSFQAIWGFSKDFNAFVARHSVNTPKLPEGLFLAYSWTRASMTGVVERIVNPEKNSAK